MKILKIINSKVRNKLIFGFVFISLFVGVVSYIGLSTIRNIEKDYYLISTKSIPLIQYLEDMKFACVRLVSSASEYAYMQSESKNMSEVSPLEQEGNLIYQSCNSCHKSFSQYEQLTKVSFPELVESTNQVRDFGNRVHIAALEFIEMKKQKISGTGTLEKKEEMEIAEMGFLKAVNHVIDHSNKGLEKVKTHLETTISSSIRNIIFFSGLTFFFSVLIGILYSRSISKPITKLIQLTNDFRKGNLDATIDIKSNDEIGLLGKSFNEMARKIKLLISQLEDEVKLTKQVGESLKKSNQQIKLILEVAGEGIFGLDVEGNLTSVNPMASKMLGYEVDELLGKHSHTLLHQSYQDGTSYPEEKCAIYETLHDGNSHYGEDYYWKKDGTGFPIVFSSLPIIEKEIIAGAVVTFNDITDRKRAEIENQVMYEITHGVTTSDSLDEMLKLIHKSLSKVVYAENCFVALYDQNTRLFSFPFFVDKFDPTPEPVAMHKSCTTYVFRKEKSLLLTQKLFDQLVEQDEVELVGTNSPSWIGVPLQTPVRTIGVLVLQHYEKENIYSERDVKFLDTIGSQIALVIERKVAEEALRESEVKLKVILESTADGILAVDSTGKIIKTNKRFAELWRIPQFLVNSEDDNALLNFVLDQLIDPEEFISKVKKLYNSTDEDLDQLHFKDGRIFERFSKPLLMNDSSIGRVWSFRDITEHIRAVETLRESEDRFRNLVENISDVFFTADRNGKLIYCSPNFFIQTNFLPKDIYGKSYLRFVAPVDRKKVFEFFAEQIKNNMLDLKVDFRAIRKDGTFLWVEQNTRIIRDNNGKVEQFRIVVRDITERKRWEEEIKKRNEQLSELIAVKDKFFTIIAHDLKSPLQGLLGLSEILAIGDEDFSKAELTEYGNSLYQSASNLFKLIENLLEWAQMQRGSRKFTPQELNLLNVTLHNIETIKYRAVQKGITIVNEIQSTERVYADEKMVDTVLRNLLSNAVKFTRRGGKVIIETKRTDTNMLEVSISDTGIGMSEKYIQKLFKIEEKVGSKGTDDEPSTGLGLLLCKEFVEKNGGKIWLESKENEGSTFYFTLPKVN